MGFLKGLTDTRLGRVTWSESAWDRVVLTPERRAWCARTSKSSSSGKDWFRRHRLPFRRGYLFYGPPGNGKTSVIRLMAAHAAISVHTLDFSDEEPA